MRPNEARFGENVAELLLIPYICMNHTETESRCHLHIYGISATFSPNLASLVCMVQEILDKIGQSIKNTKFYSLSWWHCTLLREWRILIKVSA